MRVFIADPLIVWVGHGLRKALPMGETGRALCTNA